MRAVGAAILAVLIALGALAVTPARAAGAEPTSLRVDAPKRYAGRSAPLLIELTSGGAPVADAPVRLERRVDGAWTPVATVTTGADGRASHPVVVDKVPDRNLVRATFAGDQMHEPRSTTYRLGLRRREGRVVIDAPDAFVDERSALIRVRWSTRTGEPVAGGIVELTRRVGPRDWRTVRRLRTRASGWAGLRVSPREDTRWRARARGLPWVTGDRSPVHLLDNLPPGEPVRLPAAAPRPRRLPPQPHAVGSGPHAVVTRIPDRVWRQMTGRTWHAGCPVGRQRLRLLRINYWDYSGYRRRGELVAAAGAVRSMAGALAGMYHRRLPIRAMYRVDRFGWSTRLRGGDDYASMAADNTSAFNCRDVVGRPGVLSPHASGRSLDVNPWENPYRSRRGAYPNSWWLPHAHPRVAWRSRAHPVVRTMRAHGLRWTYGLQDIHHFDVGDGRALVRAPACRVEVCH